MAITVGLPDCNVLAGSTTDNDLYGATVQGLLSVFIMLNLTAAFD